MRSIRSALTLGVALLQLLLPATHLLHVGCHHTHLLDADCHVSHRHAHSHGPQHSHHHAHSHCAHHQHAEQPQQAPESDSRPHSHAPHDSDSCPVCQVILAARIGDLHVAEVPSGELAISLAPAFVPELRESPGYRLPSRGPPA